MRVGAKLAHEVDEIEGVILDVEFACGNRDIPRVVPIGHIDFAIGDEGFHRGAEERRVMARHRCDQKDAARLCLSVSNLEVDQIAEGLADHGLRGDDVVLAVVAGEAVDPPVGFGDHPLERALGHRAPGFHPADAGMGQQGETGIGCHRASGGTEPLIGVTHGLHEVIGGHVAHRWSPFARARGTEAFRSAARPGDKISA